MGVYTFEMKTLEFNKKLFLLFVGILVAALICFSTGLFGMG